MAQAEPKNDSKQVVVELTMPSEEARQVIWQGRGSHESMGKLLDSKQIDRGDLAWAVDTGRDPKFREAARTLLAYSIGRPVALRYGPQIIEGSRDLEYNERKNFAEFWGFLGLACGSVSIGLVQFLFGGIQDLAKHWTQGEYLGVVLALVFLLLVYGIMFGLLVRFIGRKYKAFKSFRAGREGEEKLVGRLCTALDNRWTIFRNLHLPGHDDDIDIVLVGPGGVWAVEAKSSRATVRVEGKKWKMQTKTGWIDAPSNPSLQVTKDATQLNDFLKRQGIIRWIECAVALAESQPITNFADSEIPIWLLPTIDEQAKNLSTRTPPMESEISKIVEILKELATKQIAKEETR